MRYVCLLLIVVLAAPSMAQQSKPETDWSGVAAALGRTGTVQGEIYKVSMPRSDLKVSVDGIAVRPALALGSWLAFKRDANGALVMGDLVLAENEVKPVIAKLASAGIDVSAVHNHLLGEAPRVVYTHVAGHGDALKLAAALKDVLAATGTPPPSTAKTPVELGFDRAGVESALGRQGTPNGGALQFSVPRTESIQAHGTSVPPAMGVATAINFQSAGANRAAVTGDFVLLSEEVNPVLQTLSSGGITVTALHTHMLDETPKLFFMHFWGVNDPAALARTLRSALEKTNSAKGAK